MNIMKFQRVNATIKISKIEEGNYARKITNSTNGPNSFN